MTLEEKAEEYARKTLSKDCCDLKLEVYKRTINSYLACAKENGVVWHDLRKDPNDLPKEKHNVIVALTNGYSEQDSYYKYRWGCNTKRDVIAWCEMPQFKE